MLNQQSTLIKESNIFQLNFTQTKLSKQQQIKYADSVDLIEDEFEPN